MENYTTRCGHGAGVGGGSAERKRIPGVEGLDLASLTRLRLMPFAVEMGAPPARCEWGDADVDRQGYSGMIISRKKCRFTWEPRGH
jgi:hypothetical protein